MAVVSKNVFRIKFLEHGINFAASIEANTEAEALRYLTESKH